MKTTFKKLTLIITTILVSGLAQANPKETDSLSYIAVGTTLKLIADIGFEPNANNVSFTYRPEYSNQRSSCTMLLENISPNYRVLRKGKLLKVAAVEVNDLGYNHRFKKTEKQIIIRFDNEPAFKVMTCSNIVYDYQSYDIYSFDISIVQTRKTLEKYFKIALAEPEEI